MEIILEFFQQLTKMQWSDYLDILIVAFLLYKIFPLARNTGSLRVVYVVVAVVVAASLTEVLHLYTLSFILNQFLQVGLLAVVILFQPEIRRVLDHMGSMRIRKLFGMQKTEAEMAPVVAQTVMACEVMSREKVGALIVFERDNRLDECFKTGTIIDSQVSEQLLNPICTEYFYHSYLQTLKFYNFYY